ncbi:MAG: metal dependent phosphohydrolase, putative hydrolase of superfamily [Candidatus Nomurabacteria bacterium]|nr:metal dependent phosphohydrolase, putative hydrolase of superfamily [Candidatus Nomurabacteria bacterium]
MNLTDVLEFTKFLNLFQEIKRGYKVVREDRYENDVEHSYQLAMLAWFLADTQSLNLNKGLLIKYALVHDLVEVYAGDTFIYSKDQSAHDSKHDREEAARIKISEELSNFRDLNSIIVNYEKREDEESKFIYVLDKLYPVIQIYLDSGRTWKEKNITLEMVFDKKEEKLKLSLDLLPIWNELKEILIKEQDKLFPK